MLFCDDARFRLYAKTLLAAYLVIWGLTLGLGQGMRDVNGRIRGGDFVLYLAAARLATGPAPVSAYEYKADYEEENAILGEDIVHPLFFMHPPLLLLVLAPLAPLPFWGAWLIFTAVSLSVGLWAAGLENPLPRRETLFLFFAAPAVFQCVIQGQVTLATAALAAAGLALSPNRPCLGGTLLGLSLVKPHLVVPIFFYLLLKRRWRTLAFALGTVLVLAVLAEYAFGGGLWRAFAANLPRVGRIVEAGLAPLGKMTTAYAALRLLGLGHTTAFLAQGAGALAGLGACAYAALRIREQRLALAVVLGSCLLVPHYAYDYDWTLVFFSVLCLAGYVQEIGLHPPLWLRLAAIGAYVAPILATALTRIVPVQVGALLLLAYVGALLLLAVGHTQEAAP